MLAIRLPKDIEDHLSTLAAQARRTKTFYPNEAILNHLEDLEDYYLAAQTIIQIRKGNEKIYTSDEIRASLGLED